MQGGEEESLVSRRRVAAKRTNRTAASGCYGCAESVELRNDAPEEEVAADALGRR
jgi:hypothetical protein